ncbi:DNA-directed RNA polymerase subunit alpha [candidate division WOR-3 bacterium RBG_13_43_14]|uniref:DNA-directed RNA polymerase subunit alpha n=1 Tax=candidate division WOR-3 bacterium RBG_13_43_14 TaxID=1802590 RepID=A0A1F4UC22_UNCW3|nr:MAG: DNA-directed RNA polymerase subunit alpha [candidate division WOR-3 bacterium RBG_13_43_14]
MSLKPFLVPNKIEIDKDVTNDHFGRFILSPLERGFGITIGNALRRILLSSIQGSAITKVRIGDVLQEFSTIPGVYEDVVEIVLNLKKIRTKLNADDPRTLVLKVKGKKEYLAGTIEMNPEIEIITPEQKILTVTDNKVSFAVEMTVENGRGYVPAEMLKQADAPLGTVYIDAIFSPVLAVNFDIKNTRVGTKTDYDHLVIDIKTDGSVSPIESLVEAASLLKHHLSFITELGVEPQFTSKDQLDAEERRIREVLKRSIDELEISVRASNCLKNENIKTIGDLVRKSGKELLTYENFGRKSLKELEKNLGKIALQLEMNVDKYLKDDDV